MMLRQVVVFPPLKSPHRYEFRYLIHEDPRGSWRRRLKGLVKRTWPACPGVEQHSSGFEAENFTIAHSELWDSVLPLLTLTRNGGPFFDTGCYTGEIVFQYPILESVKEFFVQRAARFGLDIAIHARTYDRQFGLPAEDGHVVLFSGGKESRLICGMLEEFGEGAERISAVSKNQPPAPDLQASIVTPLGNTIMGAVMAALMSPKRWCYFGSGFIDTLRVDPWPATFDWTPGPQIEFSKLVRSLGVEKTMVTPLVVMPCTLVQKILARRYPELYRHQRSTLDGDGTVKNLHVSLLKLYNGLDCESHCPKRLFRSLLRAFVQQQLDSPEHHGFQNVRRLVNLEMRSIIFRLREGAWFEEVRELIPRFWDADWIDYIHPYVYPQLPGEFLDVFAEYADLADPKETRALVGTRISTEERIE